MKRAGLFFLVLFILGGVGYSLTRIEERNAMVKPPDAEKSDHLAADDRIREGMQAPDFELYKLDGQKVKLSALRGHPLLVMFWSTQSPTCADEMPALVSFYESHRLSGLEVLTVNVTKTESSVEDVKAFATKYKLPFPVLLDPEMKAQEAYQVAIIPTSFLLDKKGVIRKIFQEPLTVETLEKTGY
ncbi:peroxiredoxin [Aneurinibacillus soli]|uniref:Thiol-disulfide oxidoreductase ResA n=1 Tax=Aneurinibacillus soli TaxID=1500254 RepID=A0A0U5BIN3_9BACL|nr:TlpA disulfide reductase family protein [Aneurinibacillus soli]PYE64081.1 peroxiredoxin [Aneurinibacillus soli]BAU28030.1 Thiol-disulfide oxidoreductase ResA [Aneurinibacillus soli]